MVTPSSQPFPRPVPAAPRRPGALRWGSIGFSALVLLAFGGRVNALYLDFLWFESVGYSQVLLTGLRAWLTLFAISLPVFLLLFLPSTIVALALARKLLRRVPARFRAESGASRLGSDILVAGMGEIAASLSGAAAARWVIERLGGRLVVFTAVALALFFGTAAAGTWETALRALHAAPFGATDPVFGHEVSLYVFVLPLLDAVQSWLFGALVFALLGTAVLYALALYAADPTLEHASFYFHNQGRAMRAHLLVLAALLLVVVAGGFWIAMYDVLVGQHSWLAGATFTDVHARVPATQALIAATLLTALLTLASAFGRGYSLPIAGVVLMAVSLVIGRGVLPVVVQKLQVEPAELARELPYIAHSIEFTRRAFGLDGIREEVFPAEEMVRPEEIRADPETVGNLRLWDPRPLQETYNQIQSIRPYYAFGDVDVDRYRIDGRVRQVMLSARELVPARLGQGALTWVNRRLQYTHGYGVAMSPVNEFSEEGLPRLFVQDLPPTGRVPITRPEVYYGEQSAGHVIVNTGVQEFDYPSGDQNVFTTYRGGGGVSVGPLWKRALLAWHFADFNLLVSSYVTPESRVLFRRNVRERVQRVVPFAKLDSDPYLAVADGELYWILDGYTLTERYPYAQRIVERLGAQPGAPLVSPAPGTSGTSAAPRQAIQQAPPGNQAGRRYAYNYVRNSVKAVVSAYNGSVRVYLADEEDPIAAAYGRMFPKLFVPLAEMPGALREHVRYPEDLFRVQADVLRAYHVTDPQRFYNGEDVWSLAFEGTADRRAMIDPYYLIMRLPGETRNEFVLVNPFTPRGRENLSGWLAARSDSPHYGQLALYTFPRDRLVFGPAQVRQRISQDPSIAQQLTLWDQQGSEVLFGNLLVVPIGRSTLYLLPIYLQAAQSGTTTNRLPELKRVILASGNRVVMEGTVDEALARLFGVEAANAPAPGVRPAETAHPPAPSEAARAARETYRQALEALQAGDFARFGEELRRLEERLSQLEQDFSTTTGGGGP